MESEFWKKRETLSAVTIALLLGLSVGVAVYHISMEGISEDQASEMVQNAFEAQGVNVSVASVESESPSIYRVIIESGNGLQNVFVSKDGEYILNNPVNADDYVETVSAQYEFNQCLGRNNVTIVGSSQQRATQTQLQVLGGVGLQNVYLEADNRTAQQLASQGVESLPVTVVDGETFEGVRQRGFYEQRTGCSF